MAAHADVTLILSVVGLGVLVWLLVKLGHLMAKIAEAVAAAAVVLVALRLLAKAVGRLLRLIVTHWRTSLTVLVVVCWWHWFGWISLVVVVGAVAVSLASWRLADLVSFDRRVGRRLRAWWLRWTLYARDLPA